MFKKNINLIWLLLPFLFSCNESSSDDSDKLEGTRYNVRLVRAIDEKDWVQVKGSQEWWFFKGGVFRQIGSAYVEPQFFGETQACNGTASGSYQAVATEGNKRVLEVTLTYDGQKIASPGLCRMTDRILRITLQPSGAVDIVDDIVVQRLERFENI